MSQHIYFVYLFVIPAFCLTEKKYIFHTKIIPLSVDRPSVCAGHRELIIYSIDPNGETLVFDSLFRISQHMLGITICL